MVDDQPVNVKVLGHKLERNGMRVLAANDGPTAIEIAQRELPDVILLDIMMPGMDGIEVCRRLKAAEATREIPVIFITARDSKEGRLEGLGMGAADYIVKPIDLDETLARVQTQVRIVRSHQQNLELNKRLADSRRHAAVAQVTEGVAHNLNNLLGVVLGYLDLLRAGNCPPDRTARSLDHLDKAVRRMVDIVRQLTRIAEFEKVRTSSVRVAEVIETALQHFGTKNGGQPKVEVCVEPADMRFDSNRELMEEVLEQLLQNAWDGYTRLEGEVAREISIEGGVDAENGCLILMVRDRGPGVPDELREHIFDPFVTLESAVGKGLGLSIVRHSMRSLGGGVKLEPRPGGGTDAIITHPLKDPK